MPYSGPLFWDKGFPPVGFLGAQRPPRGAAGARYIWLLTFRVLSAADKVSRAATRPSCTGHRRRHLRSHWILFVRRVSAATRGTPPVTAVSARIVSRSTAVIGAMPCCRFAFLMKECKFISARNARARRTACCCNGDCGVSTPAACAAPPTESNHLVKDASKQSLSPSHFGHFCSRNKQAA